MLARQRIDLQPTLGNIVGGDEDALQEAGPLLGEVPTPTFLTTCEGIFCVAATWSATTSATAVACAASQRPVPL